MKTTTQTTLTAAGLVLLAVGSANAQSASSSASYTLLHAPAGDIGSGGPMANAGSTVTAEVSTGDPASGAVSAVTPNGVQAKVNLVGQLYDPAAVTVSATPTTVNEGGTRQLSAEATMDDATTLPLAATDVSWTVLLGPVTGIDAAGLATAGVVYEDSPATVQGTWSGISGNLGLTVLNIDADNYLDYAGDGIDDDWQVLYFGHPPNTDAGPGENPDRDPGDNLFEYLTGFDPTDGTSFFHLTADGFSSPNTMDLRLNKLIPNRTYTMTASPDLETAFSPIGAPFSVGSEQLDALFQDTTATGAAKFYRLDVTKP